MSSSTQVTGSDLFDPMTPSNLQEPFVFFAKLRKEKPVYWNEQYSFWMLTRYQDVKAALRVPRQFSSATGIEFEKRAEQIPQCAQRALILVSDSPIRICRLQIRQNIRIRGGR